MGGFDDAVRGGSFALSGAFEKYPLAVKLHAQKQNRDMYFAESVQAKKELASIKESEFPLVENIL